MIYEKIRIKTKANNDTYIAFVRDMMLKYYNIITNITKIPSNEFYKKVQMIFQNPYSSLNPKMKMEMVVSAVPVQTVIDKAREVLYTGNIGDGKIFVYDVEDVVKVRTGERGYDALQGEDDV